MKQMNFEKLIVKKINYCLKMLGSCQKKFIIPEEEIMNKHPASWKNVKKKVLNVALMAHYYYLLNVWPMS